MEDTRTAHIQTDAKHDIAANNKSQMQISSYEWVSEQILNGTSAQLGYTVPFTLDVLENTGQ